MKKTSIPLKTPLKSPNGDVFEIIIREPNVFECLELGDPFVVGASPTGSQLVIENPEVITAYVRRCLIEPQNPDLLYQGGVEMARAIKEAVISFFLPGTEADAASEISPMNSRSGASAASQTSAA